MDDPQTPGVSDPAPEHGFERQMSGFRDFYQFLAPTRVVAGRDLIGGIGFEFAKEGAGRVLIVTDEVIHGTGLIDRVRAGLEDGGLDVAGVYDSVPPDDSGLKPWWSQAEAENWAQAGRGLDPRGGRRLGDGHRQKAANVIFVHGGEPRVSGRATSGFRGPTTE